MASEQHGRSRLYMDFGHHYISYIQFDDINADLQKACLM